MFRGRRRAGPVAAQGEPLEPEISADEPSSNGHDVITLDSSCACGHTRRAHRGLRMDVKGPCLDCECQEFGHAWAGESDEETIARINSAIAQVDRLIAAAQAFRADPEECG